MLENKNIKFTQRTWYSFHLRFQSSMKCSTLIYKICSSLMPRIFKNIPHVPLMCLQDITFSVSVYLITRTLSMRAVCIASFSDRYKYGHLVPGCKIRIRYQSGKIEVYPEQNRHSITANTRCHIRANSRQALLCRVISHEISVERDLSQNISTDGFTRSEFFFSTSSQDFVGKLKSKHI